MVVIKRNGEQQELDISNIRKQTIPACEGLNNVSYEKLELDAQIVFQDGIKTSDIQKALIESALNNIDVDKPDWTYVAQRLKLYDLYHRIKHYYNKKESGNVYELVTLKDYVRKNASLFSDWHTKYTDEDLDYLNRHINHKRDKLYDYPGFCLLEDMYLLKNLSQAVELPQHMHMAVAMFAMQNEPKEKCLEYVIEAYHMLSKLEYINATPINANGRVKDGGLISCILVSMEDSADSILDKVKEVGMASKYGAGVGIDMSRLRSIGSSIKNNSHAAKGKIPFAKIFNDVALALDQGGKRQGSFCVYTECWDLEIFDFMDLRKTSGEERRRARDLYLAIMYNDLFMEREEVNGDWTLFDPKDVQSLSATFGEEFKAHYLQYEEDYKQNPSKYNPNTRVVKARDVLREHIKMWAEMGMPFVAFKDTINKAHKYNHIGLVRSSNLCVTGDTKILTKEYGNVAIGTIVESGQTKATCWNGEEWSETELFKTSEGQSVLTVQLSNYTTIEATPYHKWAVVSGTSNQVITEVETKDLKPGMKLIKFNLPTDLEHKDKMEFIEVVSILDEGKILPTYCGTEPKRHMLMFNGVLTKQCTEVTVFTDQNHTGVCNLGSINLAKFTGKQRLAQVIALATRIMDNCIDLTFYPSEASKRFQQRFRAIGCGSLGEAEYLANNKIHYGSDEHKEFVDDIWKFISTNLRECSKQLAKEKGECEANPGYRNAYFSAIAPNSSSAILAGTTNGLEPVYNKIWLEENKRGTYKITAPHLNVENYEYYKNAYEIPMEKQLEVNAIRQKYIDMAQSQNLFLDPSDLGIKRVRDLINYAWKLGIKTLYYLRSRPPVITGKTNNEISCVGCAN